MNTHSLKTKNNYLLTGILITGAVVGCNEPSPVTEMPNIIIIFTDDLGYGDVSYLNPNATIHTPNIDKMAREGLVFTSAHASGSLCTPSRYGILTGRYAFRTEHAQTGIWGFDKCVMEPGRQTIGNLLQNVGYKTACIGKWHLGLDWVTNDGSDKAVFNSSTGRSNVNFSEPVTRGPNDFGFDYSFIHTASTDIPPYLFLRNHHVIDPDIIHTDDVYPLRLDDTEYAWDTRFISENDVYWRKGVWWRSGEISRSFLIEDCHTSILEEGLKFIEDHTLENPDQPFLLYFPFTGPHTPWLPTEPFQGKSPVGEYGDFLYDMDDIVYQVNNALIRLNIAKNTLVIFTSDNGAPWPEEEIIATGHNPNEGNRGQKGDVWDGGHHVPLIISWPAKIKQPMVYEQLVSLTDIFATLADITAQDLAHDIGEDSFSFFHVLNGNLRKETRDHMVHHSASRMFGLRMNGWKYIEGLGSGGFTLPEWITPGPGDPKGQLYHIAEDPLESRNLYDQFPDKVKEMQIELDRLRDAGRSR